MDKILAKNRALVSLSWYKDDVGGMIPYEPLLQAISKIEDCMRMRIASTHQ
jgi:hypothetical protein